MTALAEPVLGAFSFMAFHRAEEAIDAGYAATRQALADWQGTHCGKMAGKRDA